MRTVQSGTGTSPTNAEKVNGSIFRPKISRHSSGGSGSFDAQQRVPLGRASAREARRFARALNPMRRVQRGTGQAKVESAEGVRGLLCRSFDGTYFFRTRKGGRWRDCVLLHSDLEVTIELGQDAAFYCIGDKLVLDHSPQTMGYKEIKSGKKRRSATAQRRRSKK